ncbi:hypothetical protein ZIOFF_030163 [Zingiber officinale]|uniref:Uncharacterized protein n=1 Tax=Zingiber officinale TaxID=94328 RepID=A0A8J5H8Z3_ZINOF|nr:hypothetical protein ZIOFF_030163 [Zingiber officinale]
MLSAGSLPQYLGLQCIPIRALHPFLCCRSRPAQATLTLSAHRRRLSSSPSSRATPCPRLGSQSSCCCRTSARCRRRCPSALCLDQIHGEQQSICAGSHSSGVDQQARL